IMAKVMVPEKEDPLTRGELKMEVPIEDANILDAAANGTTIGWQLAINVAAMLIVFIALLAMVNLGVAWLGGFFRNANGLAQFNLIAAGALVSILAVEKYGAPRDTMVWWSLPAIAVLYLEGRPVFRPG